MTAAELRRLPPAELQAVLDSPKVRERSAALGFRLDVRRGLIVTDPMQFIRVVIRGLYLSGRGGVPSA